MPFMAFIAGRGAAAAFSAFTAFMAFMAFIARGGAAAAFMDAGMVANLKGSQSRDVRFNEPQSLRITIAFRSLNTHTTQQ